MKNKKSIVNYDDDDGGDDNLVRSNSCDKNDTDFKLSKEDSKAHHKHSSSTSRHHHYHQHHRHSSSHKSSHSSVCSTKSTKDYRHRSKSRSPSFRTHNRDYYHSHSRSRRERSNSLSKNKRKSRNCHKSKKDRSRSRSRESRNHHRRHRSMSRSLERETNRDQNKIEKCGSKLNNNEECLNKVVPLVKPNTETDLNLNKPNIGANIQPPVEIKQMFLPVPVLPTIPKYYNASVVNPLKIAQQEQKRKLLWGDTKTEKKNVSPPNQSVWTNLKFQGENGSKMTDKFRKLMGIKSNEDKSTPNDNMATKTTTTTKGNISVNQEELFENLDMQYSMARMTTHTHRGVGLGFGTNH